LSRYCSKCGKENDNDSKFCVGCGEKLSGLHDINTIGKDNKDNINNINKDDKEDKNKQIILIGVVAVLIIAIAIVGAYAFMSLGDNNINNDNSYVGNSNNNSLSLGTEGSTVTKSSIPLSEVHGLAAALQNKLQTSDISAISSVEYKGVTFTKQQCLYIFAKAIDMKSRGVSGDIVFGSYSPPDSPLNSISTSSLTKDEYVDMAQRTYRWMDNNGRAPNYTGIYAPGSPDFGYDGLVLAFAIAILDSKDGSLVSIISW